MNTNPSRKKISMIKSTSPMSGKHYWREKVLEGPTSHSMGTEVPEQFLGETTQHKETDWAIDNGGDGRRKESLG